MEAIRGEGRALFDQFQAHERSLVADVVDCVPLLHRHHSPRTRCMAGREPVASDANAVHEASAARRAGYPNWVDERVVEELALPCSASPRVRREDQESNAVIQNLTFGHTLGNEQDGFGPRGELRVDIY